MPKKPITSQEAIYLKSAAKHQNVKVTVRIKDGFPFIYIRDTEFKNFRDAMAYLRRDAESIKDEREII